MKHARYLTCMLAAVVIPATGLLAQQFERLFYMVDNEDCFQSFKANIKHIDIVGPQCYNVDGDGVLWGSVDPRVLELAKKNNVKVMPLVVNPGFDQPMFHKVLHDSVAQDRAIKSMLDVCRANSLYGLQFDFENILVSDKDALTAFYKKTADLLHRNGFVISIAVVPRTSDYPGPTEYHKWAYDYWRGVYDYKALAEVGDFISFMTYEQHGDRTTPGPVAGITWTEAALKFVLKEVSPEKISLGIPFYSNYWRTYARSDQEQRVVGRGLDYKEVRALIDRFNAKVEWSDQEKVNYTFYENTGVYEYIFIEDARSLKAKLELLRKYKLRGISVWRLGHEDPEVWKVLAEEIR